MSEEIIKIDVKFLEDNKYDSVTDYCRYLMEHWDVPCPYTPETRVEVYRGEMLCLTGTSVRYCASIEPNGDHWIKTRRRRAAKAPLSDLNEEEVVR